MKPTTGLGKEADQVNIVLYTQDGLGQMMGVLQFRLCLFDFEVYEHWLKYMFGTSCGPQQMHEHCSNLSRHRQLNQD